MVTSAIGRRQPVRPGWRRVGESLVRDLSFRDFDEAFACLHRLAYEAVDYLRRPDMCIFGFNRVRVTIRNPHHTGLTEAELRLARKVDVVIDDDQSRGVGGPRAASQRAAQRAATVGRA